MPTVPYAAVAEPPHPPQGADAKEWTAYLLALQAPACEILGSTLYATLLRAAASDVRAGGPVWEVLAPHATREVSSALALRFMAAVHRLVLTRQAGELALYFPSVGGDASRADPWPALRSAAAEQTALLSEWVGLPCQTNEVGRCAALAPGFLVAAKETGLPIRLLEIGASGGLNLRWDRYHYGSDADERRWGDPDSPVQLLGSWDVPADLLSTPATVASRAGCDPLPVDPTTDDGRLRLTASVWGDQPRRFERLRGALDVASAVPVDVARARAIDWLPQRLAEPAQGQVTVVYHSVVLQYVGDEEREQLTAAIAEAGARASNTAPLYWLRMEPERPLRAMSVRLTAWPHADERLLASAGAHGEPVRWNHGESSDSANGRPLA